MIDDFSTIIPEESEIEAIDEASENSIGKIIKKYSKPLPKSDKFKEGDSPWIWNGSPLSSIPESDKNKVYSFVYKITNNITGKFYIGYKGFYSKSTRIVKHKKKHFEKESDWQKYWSSGELLHGDISYYGTGNYTRKILALCPNKAVGKFIELCYQIKYKVCTENADKTFNNILNVRLSGNGLGRYTEVIYSQDEPL